MDHCSQQIAFQNRRDFPPTQVYPGGIRLLHYSFIRLPLMQRIAKAV